MALEALREAKQRTVGVKQTEKAVGRQAVDVVYIGKDAEERIVARLIELCREKGVATVCTETMADIGQACAIHVKAAAAGILKN